MFHIKCEQCDTEFLARRRIDCYCSDACRQAGSARKAKRRSEEWRTANHVYYLNSLSEWRKANPEKARAEVTKWHRANPDKRREHCATWRKTHAEEIKISKTRWQQSNLDKGVIYAQSRRARKAQNGGLLSEFEWQELKLRHHSRCLCCHRYEPEIKLTIDHVVPVTRGGSNDISNIQPLCRKCNLSKGTQTTDYRPK